MNPGPHFHGSLRSLCILTQTTTPILLWLYQQCKPLPPIQNILDPPLYNNALQIAKVGYMKIKALLSAREGIHPHTHSWLLSKCVRLSDSNM